MFEKLIELINKTHELRTEISDVLLNIKSNYPFIYVRRKGIRAPYTYKKYDTKYLQFDLNNSAFCVNFGYNRGASFFLRKYKKTWAFSKEDFE